MTDFLPSTDNFFKYLLTIGLILIGFTIMYPIQKQKEVDIEILNYKTKIEVLDVAKKNLSKEVEELKDTRNRTQSELDSLKKLKLIATKSTASEIEKIRVQKKAEFDQSKQNLIVAVDSLNTVEINLRNEKIRIEKLGKYFDFFKTYKIILLSLGFILIAIGLRYWISSVYLDEIKKGKEHEASYRPSFVRHVDFCKRYMNWFTISLIVAFLIALLLLMCTIG